MMKYFLLAKKQFETLTYGEINLCCYMSLKVNMHEISYLSLQVITL